MSSRYAEIKVLFLYYIIYFQRRATLIFLSFTHVQKKWMPVAKN